MQQGIPCLQGVPCGMDFDPTSVTFHHWKVPRPQAKPPNPPAGGPQQTTMNPAQQIGQGSGALIDIHTFRPDDDGDDE